MSADAPVAEVAPGIHSIRMPMPTPGNPHVFAYLVEDAAGAPHLIDSGLDLPDAVAAFDAGLGALGHTMADVRTITVTHLHRDHLGLADRVRAAGGAVVAMHAAEAPDAAVTADRLLGDGDRLEIPGREFTVMHVPGHTAGSIGVTGEGVVFTGDHVLPDQFPGIGVGGPVSTNPIADYRASLERVRALDGLRVLPGHGWVFDDLGARVDETLAHHGKRTAEVAAVLAREPAASIEEIASQLTWSAGWENLTGIYRDSALRQTAWHAALVR